MRLPGVDGFDMCICGLLRRTGERCVYDAPTDAMCGRQLGCVLTDRTDH